MAEVFLDALTDTLIVTPFLFAIYVLIEAIEHNASVTANGKILQGGWAALLGSAVGLIPLCGFSVMAAKLYDKKYIKAGTLLAVFISTSDEAIIILAADFSLPALQSILLLLAIKFLLAVGVGYLVNGILSLTRAKSAEHIDFSGGEELSFGHVCNHGGECSKVRAYLVTPLLHALKIALYIFIVNIAFGLLVYFVGEARITSALDVGKFVQPLIAAAVGLIPGCASSVIIADAYLKGVISFGSMLAGLTVNAGMGFAVLSWKPSNLKRNFSILSVLFAAAYPAGIIFNLII